MNQRRNKSGHFTQALAALFLLVMYSGCATDTRIRQNTEVRPPRALEEVRVVHADEIDRSYKVIGIVNAQSFNMHTALKDCRGEAGELGADAITDFSLKDSDRLDTYTAKAIVWQ